MVPLDMCWAPDGGGVRGLGGCWGYWVSVVSSSAAWCAYSGTISKPMAFLPRFCAARSVAPEPANGSTIVHCGGQCLMSHSMSSTGFGVGCFGRFLELDG